MAKDPKAANLLAVAVLAIIAGLIIYVIHLKMSIHSRISKEEKAAKERPAAPADPSAPEQSQTLRSQTDQSSAEHSQALHSQTDPSAADSSRAEHSKKDRLSAEQSQVLHSPEIERKLWSIVKNLVSTKDIKEMTEKILEEIMDYYDADRSYIFEFDWEKGIGINTYEMCRPGVEPVIDTLQAVPVDVMDVWVQLFKKNSLILISDLDAIADDESRKEEYEILGVQGIQSLLAAPVYSDDKLVGFLGVDNPRRNTSDPAVIESLAFFCVKEAIRDKEKADLEQMSIIDPLTGAYNRNALENRKEELIKRNASFAILLVDIDDYKMVNDIYGHQVGDELLKKVVDSMKSLFRSGDMIVRYGGDEFLVILENVDSNMKDVLADKVKCLNELLLHPENDLPAVSVSAGIAFSDECSPEVMFENADKALYYVKNNGKKGLYVYNGSLDERG